MALSAATAPLPSRARPARRVPYHAYFMLTQDAPGCNLTFGLLRQNTPGNETIRALTILRSCGTLDLSDNCIALNEQRERALREPGRDAWPPKG